MLGFKNKEKLQSRGGTRKKEIFEALGEPYPIPSAPKETPFLTHPIHQLIYPLIALAAFLFANVEVSACPATKPEKDGPCKSPVKTPFDSLPSRMMPFGHEIKRESKAVGEHQSMSVL